MIWTYIDDVPHAQLPTGVNLRIVGSNEYIKGITISYKRNLSLEMLTVERGWSSIGARYYYHQNDQNYERKNNDNEREFTQELKNYAAFLFEGK